MGFNQWLVGRVVNFDGHHSGQLARVDFAAGKAGQVNEPPDRYRTLKNWTYRGIIVRTSEPLENGRDLTPRVARRVSRCNILISDVSTYATTHVTTETNRSARLVMLGGILMVLSFFVRYDTTTLFHLLESTG